MTVASDATILSGRATTTGNGVTHTLGTLSIGGQNLTIGPGVVVNNGSDPPVGTPINVNTAFGITMGATTLTGNPTFTVNNNGTGVGTLTLGAVGESGGSRSLTKAGPGTLVLNAANTYTGSTTVSAGTLTLGASGSLASPSVTVGTGATLNVSAVAGGFTLGSGQTLRGTGTVGGGVTVAGGGTLAPGGSPGILTMTGAVTLNPGSTFSVAINGPTTAGVDYSQLNLTGGGSLNLGGAALGGTIGYAAQPGDMVVIVTGGPVSNQFADGGVFNFGGYTGTVTYSGNTVMLSGFTPVPEPAHALLACGAAAAGLAGWRRRRAC